MQMEQSVPKRRYIKYRRQGITQKKAYNIQNKAKVWNQEEITSTRCVTTQKSAVLRFIRYLFLDPSDFVVVMRSSWTLEQAVGVFLRVSGSFCKLKRFISFRVIPGNLKSVQSSVKWLALLLALLNVHVT